MINIKHLTGTSSELLIAAYLTGIGKEVYFPILTQSRADFVYVDDGNCKRVQVKTGSKSYSSKFAYEQVRLVNRGIVGKRGKTYSEVDIDELWVIGTHLWRFPISLIKGRSSLFLGSDNPDPKPIRRNYNPDDFIVLSGEWDRPLRNALQERMH